MKTRKTKSGIKRKMHGGKLRIADHWNAISIIANSQANLLKSVAELVGNSIDARGIQGELGIGLLSFWTVGQGLQMTCCGISATCSARS